MTVADQLKIIGKKIKANQAQYDLDRLATEMYAYASGDLRKYEYLIGECLGYKQSVIKKANFEYSPLDMTMNRAIKSADNSRKPVKYDSGLRYGS